jgi:hypothetical protein
MQQSSMGGPRIGAAIVGGLEPIREVRIHGAWFAAARRRSIMRIIARRTNAATVVA